jgi:very-short-patch-repair endonuclease
MGQLFPYISLDARIAALAQRQHGNVTREQLLLLLSEDQLKYRIKIGRLHRVHRGVYSVGRPPKTAHERASAAVLACGRGAVLSHRAALALWGFTDRWPTRFDVTVPGDRRPAAIVVHKAAVNPRDTRTRAGIKVTSPARTLLDCAPLLKGDALAEAVSKARLRPHRVKLEELAVVVERYPRHKGVRFIKPFIETRDGPTRARWERAFPAFCERYALPKPRLAVKIGRHTVDALFEGERLIVELDGWDFHRDRRAFETDRDRDADTLALGFATVRITWERIHETPAREAARLHTILARRRAQAA